MDIRGAWTVSGGPTLVFRNFYPNVIAKRGFAVNIVISTAGRADWVASVLDGRSRDERRESACSSVLRALQGQRPSRDN